MQGEATGSFQAQEKQDLIYSGIRSFEQLCEKRLVEGQERPVSSCYNGPGSTKGQGEAAKMTGVWLVAKFPRLQSRDVYWPGGQVGCRSPK